MDYAVESIYSNNKKVLKCDLNDQNCDEIAIITVAMNLKCY